MSTLTFTVEKLGIIGGIGSVPINITGSNITIDWGDGNTITYEGNNQVISVTHDYGANTGPYNAIITGDIISLNDNCFYNNRSIIEVSLPEGLQTIGNNCFYKTCLSNITIPSTVISIGDYFVYELDGGRASLTSMIVLGDSLTTIGSDLCFRQNKLETLILPDSVTSIGIRACGLCTSLKHFEVPAGITEFPRPYFFQSVTLDTIKFKTKTPLASPPISENTLIYIPKNALSAYMNHNDYPNDINRYVLYETTIAGKIYALGTLLAENLTEKNVPSEASEGLTTLANKIPDVPSIAYQDLICILSFGDNNNEAQKRPAQVPILLFANGEIVDSCLLPRDNDTSIDIGYTSDELTTYAYQATVPVYDENNNEIFYFWHPFVENLNNYVVHQPSNGYIYLCWIEPAQR